MIHPIEQELYDALNALGIPWTRYEHPAVRTVEEAEAYDDVIPGEHCRNIFLRNKNGKQHFLVILPARKPLDLKQLAHAVHSSAFHLASPERLTRFLGVQPGAVGPFGLLHDTERHVHVLLDQSLTSAGLLKFHPNVNDASITCTPDGLLRFLAWRGNPLTLLDLPDAASVNLSSEMRTHE